jgi:hypothetical protein
LWKKFSFVEFPLEDILEHEKNCYAYKMIRECLGKISFSIFHEGNGA